MSKKRCIGNGNTQICVLPRAKLVFCSANRAENLRYQFEQGQKLKPQFRQIICLVYSKGRDTRTRTKAVITATATRKYAHCQEPS